jgi:hypothetical protein
MIRNRSTSRLQKYRLTPAGERALKERGGRHEMTENAATDGSTKGVLNDA